jgi:sugar phosphate isomerase/epimerase
MSAPSECLGYTAVEVMNKITPADISDPQELIARAKELSIEIGTLIMPGFEPLVFKASRGIEDIYELTARMGAGSPRWCRSRRCATRRTLSLAIC